jgi:predicted GIY-YIG superfamily endonuclease
MALSEVEGLSDKILCYNGYASFSRHVPQSMTPDSPLFAAHQMVPDQAKGNSVVYFLRLQSGIIYVGASTDLEQRLVDHRTGQACETTRRDPPTEVLRIEYFPIFSEARRREAQLKRWSRAKRKL